MHSTSNEATAAITRNRGRRDVQAAFDVHRNTVSNWVSEGCPHDRKASGELLFDLDEVAEWVKDRLEARFGSGRSSPAPAEAT